MKNYLFIFVIVFVVFEGANSGSPITRCGENEKFIECGCLQTCDKPEPRGCKAQCVMGCFCIEPYLKNSDGKCVLPADCKRKITEPQTPNCKGSNEVFKGCGSFCPRTCANRAENPKCVEKCQAGCFCNKGYLRNTNNLCVLERKCN